MPEKPKTPPLPPVDPDALADGVRRLLSKKRPPGGWPGKPPEDARMEQDDERGDGH